LPKANAPPNRDDGFPPQMCGKNTKAANEKLIEILDAIDNLAVFPEIGPSLRGKVNNLVKYRMDYLKILGL
jgi:hypothetical protein